MSKIFEDLDYIQVGKLMHFRVERQGSKRKRAKNGHYYGIVQKIRRRPGTHRGYTVCLLSFFFQDLKDPLDHLDHPDPGQRSDWQFKGDNSYLLRTFTEISSGPGTLTPNLARHVTALRKRYDDWTKREESYKKRCLQEAREKKTSKDKIFDQEVMEYGFEAFGSLITELISLKVKKFPKNVLLFRLPGGGFQRLEGFCREQGYLAAKARRGGGYPYGFTIQLRLGVEFLPAKEKAFPDCDLLLPAQDDAYVVFVKAKDDPSIVDLGFELPPGKRYAVASSIAALVHASHIQWVIDLDKVFYDHNREVCWMQI